MTRVLICAPADPTIGGGHLMRCLSLAQALEQILPDPQITCLVNPGAARVLPALAASGYTILQAPRTTDAICDALRAHWPKAEARTETGTGTGTETEADIAILDDYALGAETETALRAMARTLLVLNDAPTRAHDCDLLLDPTQGRDPADYAPCVPPGTQILTGARYALLRPDFAAKRPQALARRAQDTVRRVLVSFGLGDPGNLCLTTAQALEGLEMQVDIALGAAAPTAQALAELAARRADITLHLDTPDMADLMVQADLAIGAAGGTSWERACLGLPGIAVPVVDNQTTIAAELSRSAAALVLGAPDRLPDQDALRAALQQLCRDTKARHAMSAAAAAICDGQGALRTALALKTPPVTLRPATRDDARNVWDWRRADGAARYFRSSAQTPWDDHKAWFERALQTKTRKLWIAQTSSQTGNTPIGHLRLDQTETPGTWLVSICMAPDAKGKGLGRASLAALTKSLIDPEIHTLVGEVHSDNEASHRLFQACGYRANPPAIPKDPFWRYIHSGGQTPKSTPQSGHAT